MGGCVCPNFGLIKLVACNAHYNDNNDDDVSLKLINYIYGATASKGSASHGTFINIVKILKNAHVLSCTSDVGTFVSVKVNLKTLLKICGVNKIKLLARNNPAGMFL